eukprot:5106848-Pyramimonas_sp.AAC.1
MAVDRASARSARLLGGRSGLTTAPRAARRRGRLTGRRGDDSGKMCNRLPWLLGRRASARSRLLMTTRS